MNNVLIITASPHPDGPTGQITRKVIGSIGDKVNILHFDCYKTPPKPCIDCGHCKTSANCAFSDLDIFYKNFEEADAVLFIFPVYNLSFPAPLKALVDRFQVYYNARFFRNINPAVKKRKKCTVITVSGGEGERAKKVITAQLIQLFSVINCQLSEVRCFSNTDQKWNVDAIDFPALNDLIEIDISLRDIKESDIMPLGI